jgi:hypothetical protein
MGWRTRPAMVDSIFIRRVSGGEGNKNEREPRVVVM